MSSPPHNDQINTLIAALRDVNKWKGGKSLEKSYEALGVTIKYIEIGLPHNELGPIAPLMALHVALSDLLKGGKPTLFKSAKVNSTSTPAKRGAPRNMAFSSAQGAIAGLADLLVSVGHTPPEAAKWLAIECRTRGIGNKTRDAIEASQIESWRERKGSDLPENADRVFRAIATSDDAKMNRKQAEDYAKGVLNAVRDTQIAPKKQPGQKS